MSRRPRCVYLEKQNKIVCIIRSATRAALEGSPAGSFRLQRASPPRRHPPSHHRGPPAPACGVAGAANNNTIPPGWAGGPPWGTNAFPACRLPAVVQTPIVLGCPRQAMLATDALAASPGAGSGSTAMSKKRCHEFPAAPGCLRDSSRSSRDPITSLKKKIKKWLFL